jgi:hypothetical protein
MAMQKVKKYQDRLMDALCFDEGDLTANQAGRLSSNQAKALRRRAAGHALLVIGLIYLLLQPWGASQVLAVILFGLALLGFSLRLGALLLDILFQRAACVEGYLQQEILNRRAETHRVTIENRRFSMTKPVFLTFKNGDPYRIFYTPRSQRVLSVEWLREDDHLILGE